MEGSDFFNTFSYVEEPEEKRKVCDRCGRPASVCLCAFLPSLPIQLERTKLHILQHPNEENRPLHTVAILKAALAAKSYEIYKGRRFGKIGCPRMHAALEEGNCYLLYPSDAAKTLEDVVSANHENKNYNLILLDGTWKQASSMYAQNEFLHSICKVEVKPDHISEYVIRTQPTDRALSTVECVALALQQTEPRSDIKEILLKPLRELCRFQLDCGASIHQSKEFIANNQEKET